MEQIAEGLWRGVGRRPDDLAVWSMFFSNNSIVAAVGLTPARAHLGLPVMMANGKAQGRVADVSRSPGHWVDSIRTRAEQDGQHADRWAKAVRIVVAELAEKHGWKNPGEGFPLRSLATTVCWPALLSAVQAGSELPSEFPKWTRDLLSGPTINDGFIRVLGPRAASDVVEAGQACLTSDLSWWPLAAALATPQCPSDQTAKILAAQVAGPMPDDDEFELLRRVVGSAPADVASELLISTAAEANGPSRLLAALDRFPESHPLPRHLVEVELAGLRPR